jgi:F420-dependent methylenetetrahydromethanopterin dehydrogenase
MGACTAPGMIRIIQEKLVQDLEQKIHSDEEISLPQRLLWAKHAAQGYRVKFSYPHNNAHTD